MKIKTSELIDQALDWAVAQAIGTKPVYNWRAFGVKHYGAWETDPAFGSAVMLRPYSSHWAQGGPIIERENLCVGRKHQADTNYCEVNDPAVDCWARTTAGGYLSYGPTPLIAAMRCLVASKLGDEVDIPEELT